MKWPLACLLLVGVFDLLRCFEVLSLSLIED